jgi:hypothetical protein
MMASADGKGTNGAAAESSALKSMAYMAANATAIRIPVPMARIPRTRKTSAGEKDSSKGSTK